jgi:outer membrane protein TolC
MKRKPVARYLIIIVAVSLGLISPVPATLAVTPQAPSDFVGDKRSLEENREDAIFNALVSVDPQVAARVVEDRDEGFFEGEMTLDDDLIEQEVEQLRNARRKQFKYLTWSHIRKTIDADTILSRDDFLSGRDKNLAQVLERAVEVYLPAQIEKERINLAKFRIAKAVRDFLPELDITANIKNGVLSSDSFISDTWRMAFRQPIFRGGVLWNSLLLGLSNLEVAKRSYDKAISDLVADVSEAYFEYERAQNVLYDQQQLFVIIQEQKRISDEKSKVQLISEIEELNTDSLYSQGQYDLENAQQELEIALLEIRKFLKLLSGDSFEIKALYDLNAFDVEALRASKGIQNITGTSEGNDELESLIDKAYENRPDLQVEAAKLKAVQLAYRLALGRRLPQMDFLVEFGELAEAFLLDLPTEDGPNHRHEFKVGMEVTWPVAGNTFKYTYDHDQRGPSVTQFLTGAGSRTRANSFSLGFLDDLGSFATMTEAKINNIEQVVELEKTEREVVREVKEAYFNFNKSLIQVESAYKRMGYRERLVSLAKHRLGVNEVQISEYLQSEMDLVEERSLFYKALSDLFLSKAQLNKALGIRDYLTVEVLT